MPYSLPLPEPKPDWALFLDVDGTLLDIAPTPSSVAVPPALPRILGALRHGLDGAVALVSGRPLDDLDRLFSPLKLTAAGQHGGEIRLPSGETERISPNQSDMAELFSKIQAFAVARPGILVEDKGLTIAVHCRLAPQHQVELGEFLSRTVAEYRPGLETMEGNRVFEVKPRSFSKRTAVERLMATAPFAGRLPVFIGDDRTDEDGFAAVQAVGGHAIHVGLDGDSVADWRIASADAVRAFLSAAVGSLMDAGAK